MQKVSVITINFNNKAGLVNTIQSVISQTFSDFEFIIIDGKSMDGSMDVINKYSDKISNWVSEKDEGIYDALNKGLSKATGEYCFFLNSGDYFSSSDVLQKIFSANTNVDIIYGDVKLEINSQLVGEKKHPDILSKHYLLTEVVAHQAQFIKRKLFEDFGNYDLNYKIAADYEFFIRMIFKHSVSTKHLPLFISSFDISGLSNNPEKLKQIKEERKIIHKKYFPKMLVTVYYAYSSIINSSVYKTKLISIPVNFCRNIIFKFIKPRTK